MGGIKTVITSPLIQHYNCKVLLQDAAYYIKTEED